MTTLTVGQGQEYSTIAAAVAASHDGDVIQVQAGTYTNDFAEIKTKITLEGVGGMVHMVATGPIPNDKGILVTDTDDAPLTAVATTSIVIGTDSASYANSPTPVVLALHLLATLTIASSKGAGRRLHLRDDLAAELGLYVEHDDQD